MAGGAGAEGLDPVGGLGGVASTEIVDCFG